MPPGENWKQNGAMLQPSRLLAHYVPKYIPGNPEMVVQNMPGAGGLIAANHVYGVANPDGLTLGMLSYGMYLDQLVGRKEVQYDVRKFNWIGSPEKSDVLMYMRSDARAQVQRDTRFQRLWRLSDSWIRHGMLINRAPHPNASIVFLNWLLRKDGQTGFSRGMGYVSRRLDVSSDHVPPYWVPKPGVKYWPAYYEEDAIMSPEQEKFLKATFGR